MSDMGRSFKVRALLRSTGGVRGCHKTPTGADTIVRVQAGATIMVQDYKAAIAAALFLKISASWM